MRTGRARPSRGGRHGLSARGCAAAGNAEPRRLRNAGRAQDPRPARPRRARHRRRRRAPEEPQPRLRNPGPQGHGRAPECRSHGTRGSGAAGEEPELPRPRLRAGAADQCRRSRRKIGPRRQAADLDRRRRSAGHRGRTRPPERRAASDRNAGVRAGRSASAGPGRRAGDHCHERRLAPGRDRNRCRANQGALRTTGYRHRRDRGRQRQGLGPVDRGCRPRRCRARCQRQRACWLLAEVTPWRPD